MKRVIHSLTGIRALAAAWVVVFHLDELFAPLFPDVHAVQPLINAGNLGVDFFFILSGFVISYNYLERLRTPRAAEIRQFLWLRFARIYPVHLFTLLVFAVLVLGAGVLKMSLGSQGQYTLLNFAMNVFGLQAIPPAFAWNNPAWSISAEFGAYIAFPVVAMMVSRIRSRALTVTLMVVIVSAGIVALTLIVSNAEQWAYWSGYVLIWLRIIVGFAVGCLLFWLWRSFGQHRHSPWLDVASVVGFVGVIAASYAAPQNTVIVYPALALPFLALIVLGSAGGSGPVSRLLGSRLPEWGGRISYSVYMTHFILLTVAVKVLPIDRIAAGSPLVKIGVLVGLGLLVVGIGAATHYVVEEPARRALRRVRLPASRSTRPLEVAPDTHGPVAGPQPATPNAQPAPGQG